MKVKAEEMLVGMQLLVAGFPEVILAIDHEPTHSRHIGGSNWVTRGAVQIETSRGSRIIRQHGEDVEVMR